MRSKKHTGSYYTPDFLSRFVMSHVAPHFEGREKISILEPSVGDGSFIKSFNQTSFPESIKKISFLAVEKITSQLRIARTQSLSGRKENTRYSFLRNDFLKFQEGLTRKFSLIAGNPPYIKKSLLYNTQIELCNQIHNDAGLKEASVKNIWPYFLIRCSQLLEENGVLAFVLPSELLQISFSTELRQYISAQFERVEIFTFDDLLFECKGQDTILLIAYKQHISPGQYYAHIADTKQLQTNDFVLTENNTLKITGTKWTHHLLSSEELTFIYKAAANLNIVNHYSNSKPGIVTAANNFFIVNKETEDHYSLSKFLKPIIQKGFYVNGSVVFDKKEYQQIVNEGKPSKVLCISDSDVSALPKPVKKYLQKGVKLGLPDGYKCSMRNHWYVIPNILPPSDGFFFRRVHHYPKLLKNTAGILVTDTAYQVEMNNGFNIESLIYSFYNSLSLAFAELSGRYYGGGVLELTPSEFKSIPIPYQSINAKSFKEYRAIFETKSSIYDVLNLYDSQLLHTSLGLSREDIEKIQTILKKLVAKRFRK